MKNRILFLFLLISLFRCGNKELPEFQAEGGHCPKETLVLLSQPEADIQDGNELLAVYCKSEIIPTGAELQLSLVFRDERHPSGWKDFFYRIYRRIRYGRTFDIESFTLLVDPNGKTESIRLQNVYSGKQVFEEDPVLHFDAVLSSRDWETKNSVPLLHINTWNHMFGEKDNNPGVIKQEIPVIGLRSGSRIQLDSYFGGN